MGSALVGNWWGTGGDPVRHRLRTDTGRAWSSYGNVVATGKLGVSVSHRTESKRPFELRQESHCSPLRLIASLTQAWARYLAPNSIMDGRSWTNSGHRQTAIAWPKSALSENQLAPPLGPLVDIVTPHPTDIPSSALDHERH
jgi:hypothetical protein